jgi:isopenicillin-N N-acyltransferase-like protein
MSIDIITLEGTPAEMGARHGELLAEGARAMCESRIELSLKASGGMSRAEVLALAGQSLPVFADYAPDTYAEFCGIAEGAGVTREELFIGNGYTDFVDLVRRQRPGPSECTHFAVRAQACGDGKLRVGQTWDMAASAYPHVVAFRRLPKGAPATLTVTTAGCLALIGLNEHGIAVGNTNLTPHDAQTGVMYLAMLHTALAQSSFDAAVRAFCDAPRMSGHYYYVAAPADNLAAVETTALRHVFLNPDARGLLAHANHYVAPELVAYVEADTLSKNTRGREARMWELLRATPSHDTDSLWRILQDHEAPLCRHEDADNPARTCAAAVMTPADRSIRMAKGYPCEAQYVEATLR